MMNTERTVDLLLGEDPWEVSVHSQVTLLSLFPGSLGGGGWIKAGLGKREAASLRVLEILKVPIRLTAWGMTLFR